MDLISFAQNQEDVMLWRALGCVTNGFYIDVGAADPTLHSITKLFYDRNWCGINIEPSQAHFEHLRAYRERDINLQLCITAERGEKMFHEIPETGLSTLSDEVSAQHVNKGWKTRDVIVRCSTLADICFEYRPDGPIHFLKIDVEGGEFEVLQGADFVKFRPWVIVIEATAPLSTKPNYEAWETLLKEHSYRFVWFDGLNRFYLAQEHNADLARHFTVQPNVFDQFVRPADLLKRIEELESYGVNEHEARVRTEFERDRLQDVVQPTSANHRNEQAALEAAEIRHRIAQERAQAVSAALREALNAAAAKAELRASRINEQLIDVKRRLNQALMSRQRAEAERLAAEHRYEAAQALIARLTCDLDQAGTRVGRALEQAANATEQVKEAARSSHDLEAQRQIAEHRSMVAERLNRAYRESTSWRLTRPIRGVLYVLRRKVRMRDVILYATRGVPPRLYTAVVSSAPLELASLDRDADADADADVPNGADVVRQNDHDRQLESKLSPRGQLLLRRLAAAGPAERHPISVDPHPVKMS